MVDLKKTALHYQNYLKLDKILHAQFPMSKELGDESHDEMLFIIIHQAYELWFKQIIHELKSVKDTIKDEKIDEKEIIKVVKISELGQRAATQRPYPTCLIHFHTLHNSLLALSDNKIQSNY